MKPPKLHLITYIKLGLFVLAYLYLLLGSGYQVWQGLKNREDVMNPLMGFAFAIIIGIYVAIGKSGKPNPPDRNISPFLIFLLMLIILAGIGYVFWFSLRINS